MTFRSFHKLKINKYGLAYKLIEDHLVIMAPFPALWFLWKLSTMFTYLLVNWISSRSRAAQTSTPAVGTSPLWSPGNEKADELARLGAKGRQQDNSVTFQERKTVIRAALEQRTERDEFHFFHRWQQVVVMRLSIGHKRLNTHMYSKIKLGSVTTSNCGLDQTAEHSAVMPTCADGTTKCVANSSPSAHQPLRQQRGTGEDGHVHFAHWTLTAAAIEQKENWICITHAFSLCDYFLVHFAGSGSGLMQKLVSPYAVSLQLLKVRPFELG